MKRYRRKIILLTLAAALAILNYATPFPRIADCWIKGGSWNGGFCRLNSAG